MASPMKSQVPIAAKPLAPIAPQPSAKLVPLAVANMPLMPANGKTGKGTKASKQQQAAAAIQAHSQQQQQQQQQQARPFYYAQNGSLIFANFNGQNAALCQASTGQPLIHYPSAPNKPAASNTAQNGSANSIQSNGTGQQPTFHIMPFKPTQTMMAGMPVHANGSQQIIVPLQFVNNMQAQQTAQPVQQQQNVKAATNGQANSGQSTQQAPSTAPSNPSEQQQQQQMYQQSLFNLQKAIQTQQQQQPQQQIFINPFQQPGQMNHILQQNGQGPQPVMLNHQNLMNMFQAAAVKSNGANMVQINGALPATAFTNGSQTPQIKQEEAKKPVKPKEPTSQNLKPVAATNGHSPKKNTGSPKASADISKNNESHNDVTHTEADGGEVEADTSNVTNSVTKKRGRPRLYEINPINGKSIKGKFLAGSEAKPPASSPTTVTKPAQNGMSIAPAALPVGHLFNSNLLTSGIYPSPSPTSSSASSSSSSTTSSYSAVLPVQNGKVPSIVSTKTPDKQTAEGARALRPIKAKQDLNSSVNLNSSIVGDNKIRNEPSPSKAEATRTDDLNSDNEQQKENKNSSGLVSPTKKSSPSKTSKRPAKDEEESETRPSPVKGKVQRLSPQSMRSNQVVLTHVIDGYVIKESSKPFPVKPLPPPPTQVAEEEPSTEAEHPYSSTPKKDASPSKASKSSPKKQSQHNESAELMDCSMTSNKSCSKSHKCKRHRHHKHHRKHSSRSKLNESQTDKLSTFMTTPGAPRFDEKLTDSQFLSPQLNPFTLVYSQGPVSSSPTMVPPVQAPVAQPSDQQLPGGDPTEWNCDEVYQFVQCVAGVQIAQLFKSQEVDGSALTLIRDDHLVNTMQIKLGPALKIMSKFNELKEKFSKQLK